MPSLRIIFAGSGEFGLPALQALRQAGHEIVHVYSQPDRPAGRGRKLSPTPISQYAIGQHLPLTRTAELNSEPLPAADVLVVIAFGQKVADSVIHHCRLGAINLHASILPRHRGAAPINAAILAGDTVAGNSVIRLAQKMDAGAVLAQSQLNIGPLETAGELHDRLAADGAALVSRVVADLAAGRAVEVEQDHSKATLARKISRETSRLDFRQPADLLARQVRGMYPWPGCRVRLLDGDREIARLTLMRAVASEEPAIDDAAPGAIDSIGQIACGAGRLTVVELQPEAGRPMPLHAYRNGHVWSEALRVESV